ncbi:MAG TPA: PIN domain-containing protein [Anaeromyxobacteraceae bacterium]|nr:PIN domain-containing protein [Anaeromyxobacteraceae bacterium]
MAADLVFIDTNVLVAASVEGHPSHAVATALLDRLADQGTTACVSAQVCREFLAVLTRGPIEGRSFGVEESLEVLDGWMTACDVLDDSGAVLPELLVSETDVSEGRNDAVGAEYSEIEPVRTGARTARSAASARTRCSSAA